jgi:putative nucleotidyltransferase with HDIG domain
MTAGLPKEPSFICLRRYNLLQFFYIIGSQMKNGDRRMSHPEREECKAQNVNLESDPENPYRETAQVSWKIRVHVPKLNHSYSGLPQQPVNPAPLSIIQKLSAMTGLYDLNTRNHQERTAVLARAIAFGMGLTKERVDAVYWAALVHDIGKFRIPKAILCKPGKLNDQEYGIIQKHPQYGFEILQRIDLLKPIAPIILQHHERVNGSGYPRRIRGDEILLEAKILGVADVVDAMTSNRPYRPALKDATAMQELYRNRNILYDPEVIDTCIAIMNNETGTAEEPASFLS